MGITLVFDSGEQDAEPLLPYYLQVSPRLLGLLGTLYLQYLPGTRSTMANRQLCV